MHACRSTLEDPTEFSPCLAHDAPGLLQFSNYAFRTRESDGSATVSVMRSAGAAGKVTVHYTTVDPAGGQQGEATPGADYTKTSGTLTFEEGEYLKSFEIPVAADGQINEETEVINLKLSNPTGGAALGEYDFGVVSLYNTKLTNPAVTVSDAVLGEGDSGTKQAALNVHVGPHTDPVVVTYVTKDGTAAAGEDYGPVAEGKLTFAPGEAAKTILIDVHGDAKPEKDEVLFVAFEVAGGYAFNEFGHQQRQVVITNDDAFPPAFAFEVSSLSTAENAGAATLNVVRTGSAAAAASVNYSTAALSAKAGADYGHASGTLSFAPGETAKPLTVQLTDDQTHEGLEEFEVALAAPSAGAGLGAPSSAKIYVADNDPAPSLSVSDTSVVEGDSGTADAVFHVTLSAASGLEVNVNYATANLLAQNPAFAGEDYAAAQGQLTFAPGETSKQVVVKVSGDEKVEGDEVFALALADSDSATLADKTAVCTVKDDDAEPAAEPSLSVSSVAVTEGDSTTTDAVFNVTLSAAGAGQVTVSYATADVAALNSAQAGADYAPAAGTLLFAPGETSKTIAVAVKGDTDFEKDELFVLTLSAAVGATLDASGAVGQCTVKNDDAAPGPTPTPEADTFQFEQAVYDAAEGGAQLTVTVTRSGETGVEASVDYETVSGTADDRGEFTTAVGTLRFAPGEKKKSLDILLTEDSLDEAETEQAQVVLSNPSAGVSLGAPAAAVIRVADDAPEPAGNASDDPAQFVRQHYHDFLGREPDAAGLKFWADQLTACGGDAGCLDQVRQNVSAAFFLSIEFRGTGYLAFRLSRASFGAPQRYRDFIRDSRRLGAGVVVGQAGWEQRLAENREAFASEWVARAEFQSKYGALSNEQYVDALFLGAGVAPAAGLRQALVSGLDSSAETRASVLLKVADDPAFDTQCRNAAFVQMQYFGYLRRDPDAAPDLNMDGYHFWLQKLEAHGGDFVAAEMVKAFLVSGEYRSRFGQP